MRFTGGLIPTKITLRGRFPFWVMWQPMVPERVLIQHYFRERSRQNVFKKPFLLWPSGLFVASTGHVLLLPWEKVPKKWWNTEHGTLYDEEEQAFIRSLSVGLLIYEIVWEVVVVVSMTLLVTNNNIVSKTQLKKIHDEYFEWKETRRRPSLFLRSRLHPRVMISCAVWKRWDSLDIKMSALTSLLTHNLVWF